MSPESTLCLLTAFLEVVVMSSRRLAGLITILCCIVFMLHNAGPASAESAAMNPDVGEAIMAIDLFAIRSTPDLDLEAQGASCMFGISSRATAILQVTGERSPLDKDDIGLVFEGRLRFYFGNRGQKISAIPHVGEDRTLR